MLRMSYTARWALFFILLTSLGLIAYKVFKTLPTRSAVRSKPHPKSQNYKLNKRRKEISNSHALSTSKRSVMIKPATVPVTRPAPKPVIKHLKQVWKKKGVLFYREITPITKPKLHVLLLHGRKFTSENWETLKTMDILASNGYHAVAMDLPGHGKSKFKFNDSGDKNRAKVLGKFIRKVGLVSPVIVSPSASGLYSLPYITSLKTPKPLSGFVSIAVAGTDRVLGKDLRQFPPTLIVRGSRDTSLGLKSTNFLKLYVPRVTVKVINEAGHACYIDKPGEFHEILLKFLGDIVK